MLGPQLVLASPGTANAVPPGQRQRRAAMRRHIVNQKKALSFALIYKIIPRCTFAGKTSGSARL